MKESVNRSIRSVLTSANPSGEPMAEERLDGTGHRLVIDAVPGDRPRPLWSVMIPTFHCARYLGQTLASVLAQAPGPEAMQIEVVDDCSTKDDPEAVVREVGRGRVAFYRQPRNGGHTRNFETCLRRSRGRLVHLLHGDDAVRPGFYERLGKAFDAEPSLGAAFCRNLTMDENGHWVGVSPLLQPREGILANLLELQAVKQRIQTPSITVRRAVYEDLGAFDRRLSWTEDWEMWTRIASRYPVWHEPEPLAVYRVHSSSNTGRYMRTGEALRDLDRLFGIIEAYVPGGRGRQLCRTGRRHYAREQGIATACLFLKQRDLKAAAVNVKESLKLCPDLPVVARLATSLPRAAARALLKPVAATA